VAVPPKITQTNYSTALADLPIVKQSAARGNEYRPMVPGGTSVEHRHPSVAASRDKRCVRAGIDSPGNSGMKNQQMTIRMIGETLRQRTRQPMSNGIDLDKVTSNILATVAQSELGL
jgi:hypothetical protein